MTVIDTNQQPSIGSFLSSMKDIAGATGPKPNAHIYRTTAFTHALATGRGGWLDVAVKTDNLGDAYKAIGHFLHDQYPELYTSPKDWTPGGIHLNYELQDDFTSAIGMDPHDMPAYVVFPLTHFRWRQDHHKDITRHDLAVGEVPPFPDDLNDYAGLDNHTMKYAGNKLMVDPATKTYRCPWCQRTEQLTQGAEAQHNGHTISRRGNVIVAQRDSTADPITAAG